MPAADIELKSHPPLNSLYRILVLIPAFVLTAVFSGAQEPMGNNTGSESSASSSHLNDELFSGIQTRRFENGFKMWFKPNPSDAYVRITLSLGYGALQDPLDKPGTAHFVEHLLLESSGIELPVRELENRGGVINGFTMIDRTVFQLDVPANYWKETMEVLYRLILQPVFSQSDLESERIPILAELKFRGPNSHDWFRIRNPFSTDLEKDYLRNEFGLNFIFHSLMGNEHHIRSISMEDIKWYYGRYFVPESMTLLVIGDLNFKELERQALETFGQIQRKPVPDSVWKTPSPMRFKQNTDYEHGSFARYEKRYKFYDYSSSDFLYLEFLRGFLEEYLTRRLRNEFKRTYSPRVELITFLGQAYLSIVSEFQKEDIEVARFFIDLAVDQLRTGNMPEAEFESIRRRTIQLFAYRNSTADDLIQWVISEFYQRSIYDEIPDLLRHHRELTQDEVSDFVRSHFEPKKSTIHITRPYPEELQTIILLSFSLPGLAFLILRSRWKKSPMVSFPMSYTDINLSWFNWVLILMGAMTLILIGISFGNEYLLEKQWHPTQVQHFYAKYAGLIFVYGTPCLLTLGILGSIPKRLYFYDRGCRIESFMGSYLSAYYHDIETVEECRLVTALVRKHCRFFYSINPFQKGISIKLKNRSGIFLLFKEQQQVLDFFQQKLNASNPPT